MLSAGTDYYIKNGIAGEYTKIDPEKIFKKDANNNYAKVNITDVKAGSSNYYCEVERIYTYTIYLTIEYVQGPNINGKITVDNCALPGEMVRLRKNQISIEADESFSANGYYWRIGKRKQNEKGNWVFEALPNGTSTKRLQATTPTSREAAKHKDSSRTAYMTRPTTIWIFQPTTS